MTAPDPHDDPCAHCGARPSYEVRWTASEGEEQTVLYLCARCDEDEMHAIEGES